MVLGRLTTGYIQQLPIVIFYYQHVVVVFLKWECYNFLLLPFVYFFYTSDNICVTKIEYIIHSVQDYKIPCNNGVRMVKCEG